MASLADVKRFFDEGLGATGAQPETPGLIPPVRARPETVDRWASLQRRDPANGELVELDTESGAPFGARLGAAFGPDEDTRQAILQQNFSESTVEPLPEGMPEGFILRNYRDPASGRTKDLLVDERGFSVKDLADLGNVGIEILGAYSAMRGGRGLTSRLAPGIGRASAEAAMAGIGANVTGAGLDVAARQQAGQPIQPGEIAGRRAVQTGIDTVADIGLAGIPILAEMRAGRVGRGMPSTPQAEAAMQAQQRLAGQTGVEVGMTLGQRTGSRGIQEVESFLERATLGGGPIARQRARTVEELNRTEAALVGNQTPLTDKDTLGWQAVRAIRQAVGQVEGATTSARTTALDNAVNLLHQAIDSETNLGARAILAREAGNAIQAAQRLKKDSFDDIAATLKSQVRETAGTDAFIPTRIARKHLEPLLKTITRPESGEYYEYIPPKVKAFVNDVMGLPRSRKAGPSLEDMPEDIGVGPAFIPPSKGLVTLDELRDIRTGVNEAISESQILGTAESHKLQQISHALTNTLEEGIEHAPNPGAKEALSRFNKFYRENKPAFEVRGVTELIADPTQRKIGPSSVFRSALASEDQYFRLKDALTKPLMLDSQPVGPVATGELTWSMFKQAVLNESLDEARIYGGGQLIDASKFLESISSKRLGAEVRRDLLGVGADVADKALARLANLQNPKLDAGEVLDVLRRGGDTAATDIEALAIREAELANLYRNQVIKKFAKGDIGSESIQSGDFIDRYLDIAPAPELRQVMGLIQATDPALAQTIREKTVANIFQKARKSPFEDVPAAKKLAQEIRTEEMQKRLSTVLGPNKTRDLNDFMDLLAGTAGVTQGASKATGGISAGMTRMALLAGKLQKVLPHQYLLTGIGALMANPKLYRVVTSPVQPVDPSAAIRRLFLEEDMLGALYREFQGEAATVVQDAMSALESDRPAGQTSPAQVQRFFDQQAQPAR